MSGIHSIERGNIFGRARVLLLWNYYFCNIFGIYLKLFKYLAFALINYSSSINELVDCSEDAARKICGNEAAKFTRQLVDKYANSLTKVRRRKGLLRKQIVTESILQIYCEDFTRNPGICRDGEGNGSTRAAGSSLGLLLTGTLLTLLVSRGNR